MPSIALKDEASALAGFLLLQDAPNEVGTCDCLIMVAPGARSMAADALGARMHQEFQVSVSGDASVFSVAGDAPGGARLQLHVESGGKGEWQLFGDNLHIAGKCELAGKK